MGSPGKDGKEIWLSMFKNKVHCIYVWNFQRINRSFKKGNKNNSSKIYLQEKKHYKQWEHMNTGMQVPWKHHKYWKFCKLSDENFMRSWKVAGGD